VKLKLTGSHSKCRYRNIYNKSKELKDLRESYHSTINTKKKPNYEVKKKKVRNKNLRWRKLLSKMMTFRK
jgi:hypothetical protein